jgi:hypothetical protein
MEADLDSASLLYVDGGRCSDTIEADAILALASDLGLILPATELPSSCTCGEGDLARFDDGDLTQIRSNGFRGGIK